MSSERTDTARTVPTSSSPKGGRARLPCQVCGRRLVPLRDGTSRYHCPRRGSDYCHGSRHRLARWSQGQQLRHHAGSVWEVVQDMSRSGNYLLRCIVGTPGWMGGEKVGREMCVHGEYMHRDGWREIAAAVPKPDAEGGGSNHHQPEGTQ